MHYRRKGWVLLLVALLLGLSSPPAQAQREYYNWYFGNLAGLTFTTTPTQGLANGQRSFPYGAACISDSLGQFRLASDGYTIWDRQWQPLPGFVPGHQLVGFNQRQVLLVRQPGPGKRYYVVRNSNQFLPGQYPLTATTRPHMPYAVVDLAGRNGLGAIVARDSIALPPWTKIQAPYLYLNTNWVAIRHANGRDIWLTAQTVDGDYLSCLLTAAGLGAPIISPAPRDLFTVQNGILRASPDGRTLVATLYLYNAPASAQTQLQVSRFDPATGQIRSFYDLPQPFRGRVLRTSASTSTIFFTRVAGLAISPDGSRLYADTTGANAVFQYDLLAASPSAVAASRTAVIPQIDAATGVGYSDSGDLQLGPDGLIYVIRSSFGGVGRIEQPNALAPFCRFVADGVRFRGGGAAQGHTFPIPLNDLNLPPVQITAAGTIQGQPACEGELVPFASSLSPFITATAFAWDFGDPASGASNQASGQAPLHRYAQSGTYTVVLRITTTGGQQVVTQLSVVVRAVPSLAATPNAAYCTGGQLLLSPGPQPTGTTYRWQDGSTAATYLATQPGPYAVRVTGPGGCSAQATWQLVATDCVFQLPNIITPNGDAANDYFVLQGLYAPDWNLTIFDRWGRQVFQQANYTNQWAAAGQSAGTYYYLLRHNTTGQQQKGWVEVVK